MTTITVEIEFDLAELEWRTVDADKPRVYLCYETLCFFWPELDGHSWATLTVQDVPPEGSPVARWRRFVPAAYPYSPDRLSDHPVTLTTTTRTSLRTVFPEATELWVTVVPKESPK